MQGIIKIFPHLAWLMLFFGMASAQDEGLFVVRSVNTNSNDGVLYLDAYIDYALSSRAIEALHSGIELNIDVEINLRRNRNFLPDDNIATLTQEYILNYNELTERYSVLNINSRHLSTFTNIASGLNSMGRLSRIPVIDETLLNAEEDYIIELRSSLNVRTDYGLTQFLNVFRNNINIESEWFRWQVD
jgi:hypothetical protein